MNLHVFAVTSLTAALFTGGATDAVALKPGFAVGDGIGHMTNELAVTGPGAGEKVSVVCRHAKQPVALIYAREPSPALLRLIKRIDEATGKHAEDRLASGVVFLNDNDKLIDELKALAMKEKIQHTALTIDLYGGPVDLDHPSRVGPARLRARLGKDADVTVLLCANLKVKASYAFRKGELTDKDIDQVLADLPKLLLKKAEGLVVPDKVSGEWLNEGNKDQPCAIFQQGRVLLLVNEKGDLATARMTEAKKFVTVKGILVNGEGWEEGLVGEIVEEGKAIAWKNGSTWKRP